MPAAHNTYAEQLYGLGRGNPLYYPEPRPEGSVEIGDVGYIKHGAFRRLFNVSKPAGHAVQRFGIPVDFVQLDIGHIDTFEAALKPGPLYSKSVSTVSTEIGTPSGVLPAQTSFHFSCSSNRGAILMLEAQMIRNEAVQEHRLESYLIQHCHYWHAFARSLDIYIGFGDLMLVTECSKTAAWSSAVYSNSSTDFGLSFSVGMPVATTGIAASRSLEKIGPIERRRSQQRAQAEGPPLPINHTVFIKAYRLGMRQSYYQSLVFLFMRARKSNQGARQGVDRVVSQSATTSQVSSSPYGSLEYSVMRHYGTDFNASIPLLALEMEKNEDSDCVILHDDVWCTASPDSEKSGIMRDYAEYYFSDGVGTHLNYISGVIPYHMPSQESPNEPPASTSRISDPEGTDSTTSSILKLSTSNVTGIDLARLHEQIPRSPTPTDSSAKELMEYQSVHSSSNDNIKGDGMTRETRHKDGFRTMTGTPRLPLERPPLYEYLFGENSPHSSDIKPVPLQPPIHGSNISRRPMPSGGGITPSFPFSCQD